MRTEAELMDIFEAKVRKEGRPAALAWAATLEKTEVLIIAEALRTGRRGR